MKSFITCVLLVLLATCTLYAQKNIADERFKLYKYEQAIAPYEKYIQQNPTDYQALKSLAVCYQLTNNITKASETYKAIVALPDAKADDTYQLIQLLRTQQNISLAKTYAVKFKEMMPGEKATNLIKALDMYETLMKPTGDYIVTNKTGKHPTSVFCAIKYRNQILVTAENSKAITSNWTGRGYTDLFSTDNSFEKLVPFAKDVMIKLDDGTPAFADNGNTMYYTSIHDDFTKDGNINTQKLKIAVASFDGSKWTKAPDFTYNSLEYKVAHPAISKDGSMLVFDSDMPGGKGGMDLYICTRQGNTWSTPQNMGELNTTENELFPIFNDKGDLLFSSNGLPGLGGLDVFLTRKSGTEFEEAVNMKAPFNSSYDDFFLFSDDELNTGYLSTNRFDDPQIDDVLYFERTHSKTIVVTKATGLLVNVLDKYTRTPLPYVTVIIKDKSGQVFHQGLTDPNGQVDLDELPKGEYTIQGMLNDVSTTLAKVTEADFAAGTKIVKELLHNDPRFTLAGIAVNTKTRQPLEDVLIVCTNITSGVVKKMTTGPDGKFFFQLEQSSDFEVQGMKKGWLSSEVAQKTTKGLDRSQQLYVNLELNIERPVLKGTITLKKIHYSYDKCDIRPDAAVELNRLVKLMNDYPDMTIELSSHTDARGSDEYNVKLSQCRAESAVNYLIQQDITTDRMHAKGYGETKLVNGCKNGVNCTDIEHEENRRTEFTIMSCASCPK